MRSSGGCDHCGWHCVADGYPELIGRYQSHLRDEHPKAWLRTRPSERVEKVGTARMKA